MSVKFPPPSIGNDMSSWTAADRGSSPSAAKYSWWRGSDVHDKSDVTNKDDRMSTTPIAKNSSIHVLVVVHELRAHVLFRKLWLTSTLFAQEHVTYKDDMMSTTQIARSSRILSVQHIN